MIIIVKVKTNSSQQKIEKFGDNRYLIYLKSEPEHNKANIELINSLSKYVKNPWFLNTSKIRINEDFLSFGIPYTHIKFKSGLTTSEKVLELK